MNVYEYIVDGVSSVQSDRCASLVTDDSLWQSIERVSFPVNHLVFFYAQENLRCK